MTARRQPELPAASAVSPRQDAAPKPRRVLFHIRHFGVGGIETALLGWLRGLDRDLFTVALSVALPTRDFDTVYRARIPDDVPVHFLIEPGHWLARLHQRRRDRRLGILGRAFFGIGMSWLGRRRITLGLARLAPSCDVIIDYDLTLRKQAPDIRVPLVGVRHFRFWLRRSSKARRVGRDYRHYDSLLVLNDDMLEQARRLYGDQLRQIRTLPNAFDFDAIRAAARESVVTPFAGGPYVVCVGRMEIATKGLDTLMRAWRMLRSDCPELSAYTLVFVGDGPDRSALSELADALDIADAVHFAGMLRNPYPWMLHASALVLASRSEALPSVLIEAMALGCMVVSTDCPVGPKTLLADGRAGVLVPVDDAAALMRGLRRALTDQALRTTCLEVAREQVEYYGIAAGNRRFLTLVDELLLARRRDAGRG